MALMSPPSNTEQVAFELKSLEVQSIGIPLNSRSMTLPVQNMFLGSWNIRVTAFEMSGSIGARSTFTVSGMPYNDVLLIDFKIVLKNCFSNRQQWMHKGQHLVAC